MLQYLSIKSTKHNIVQYEIEISKGIKEAMEE